MLSPWGLRDRQGVRSTNCLSLWGDLSKGAQHTWARICPCAPLWQRGVQGSMGIALSLYSGYRMTTNQLAGGEREGTDTTVH